MSGFSIVPLLALIAGILAIFLIRKRYRGITTMEVAIIIILYTALILLFTDPVINGIRSWLSD